MENILLLTEKELVNLNQDSKKVESLFEKGINVMVKFVEDYITLIEKHIISILGAKNYKKIKDAVKTVKRILSKGFDSLDEKSIKMLLSVVFGTLAYLVVVNREMLKNISENFKKIVKRMGNMTLSIIKILKRVVPVVIDNIINLAAGISLDGLKISLKDNVVDNISLTNKIMIGYSGAIIYKDYVFIKRYLK